MMAASWGGCLLVCESCWLWPSVATHDGSILGFVFSVSKPQDSESGWLWQRVGCGSNSPAVAVEDAIVELDHLAADDRRPADDDQRVLTAAGQRSSAKTRPADPALPCALPCALRRRRRLSLYASSLRGLSLCDGVHACASARTTCMSVPLPARRARLCLCVRGVGGSALTNILLTLPLHRILKHLLKVEGGAARSQTWWSRRRCRLRLGRG